MKIRTALILAGLTLTAATTVLAQEHARVEGPAFQVSDDRPLERDPADRASRQLKVPVILDGVTFPAGYDLPHQALSFVLTKEDVANKTVHAFSSDVVAKEFMRQQKSGRLALGSNAAGGLHMAANDTCDWTQDYSWFNKNVGCGGSDVLTLYQPNEYNTLDFGGWNNTISCVKAACVDQYTVIYSCRYFDMSVDSSCGDPDRWYVLPGQIITDLNAYGMNNRTSSIRFEY